MAYLEGLLFTGKEEYRMSETKMGVPVYGGTAAFLDEWSYKVNTRRNALMFKKDDDAKKEAIAEYAAKVVEGLRDDALKVAMDLGYLSQLTDPQIVLS